MTCCWVRSQPCSWAQCRGQGEHRVKVTEDHHTSAGSHYLTAVETVSKLCRQCRTMRRPISAVLPLPRSQAAEEKRRLTQRCVECSPNAGSHPTKAHRVAHALVSFLSPHPLLKMLDWLSRRRSRVHSSPRSTGSSEPRILGKLL